MITLKVTSILRGLNEDMTLPFSITLCQKHGLIRNYRFNYWINILTPTSFVGWNSSLISEIQYISCEIFNWNERWMIETMFKLNLYFDVMLNLYLS
jgi:hypothetical protein